LEWRAIDTGSGTNSIMTLYWSEILPLDDYMTGCISEIIIYDSDQSANRTAIEANIGETYGITGIPAYDNTVDGFVETWYDQSGNGNILLSGQQLAGCRIIVDRPI
jgi:hypothetical protein